MRSAGSFSVDFGRSKIAIATLRNRLTLAPTSRQAVPRRCNEILDHSNATRADRVTHQNTRLALASQ